MNFRQLKAFNVVMRHGTITAAARELRVSQPSVTRLIHELESALGFSLFVRQGRGVLATMEARRFHQAVESAFINIERLDELATAIRQDTIGKISLGVIPNILGHRAAPDFGKDTGQSHKNTHGHSHTQYARHRRCHPASAI
jgi:DNA-binding transcriptional LysR family regulator